MAPEHAAPFWRLACVPLLLATISVSLLPAVEGGHRALCKSGASGCEAAEASSAASLLQVQSHSAGWPRGRIAKPTSLPVIAHQIPDSEQPPSSVDEESLTTIPNRDFNSKQSLSTSSVHEEEDASPTAPHSDAPCSCDVDSLAWKRPAPRPARCIFIDLGAADGNTFQHFLKNGYGEVGNCPSGGEYEAILVEANPIFDEELLELEQKFSGRVRSLNSSAAYMCEGSTSFYLDTVDVKQHYWGSSMSPNTNDVKRSGKKHVQIPLVNVARLIVESALPDDYVLVKMDIEGSEHDIVPCLAQSQAAHLIDAIYVEKHPVEWSIGGAKQGALQKALSMMQGHGVVVPEYDSPS